MKIIIETIKHEDQRYPTIGDWYYDPDGTLHIKVSEMRDDRHAKLVALHELVEVLACEHSGITQEMVDEFDMAYEKNRKPEDMDSEPGDDPLAPYCRQHCIATGVERIVAAELGVNWSDYADEIEALP